MSSPELEVQKLQRGVRVAAAVVALSAWVGLALQMIQSVHERGSVWAAAWSLLAYFTIFTNVLVALVFTSLAAEGKWLRTDALLAGTMLWIVLVAVVYALLLAGTAELRGLALPANVFLHQVTPALVVLYWPLFARKGRLSARHLGMWMSYPLAYLAYALLRGHATRRYAYPFLNVARRGWEPVLITALVMTVAFLLLSVAVLGIDHALCRRRVAMVSAA